MAPLGSPDADFQKRAKDILAVKRKQTKAVRILKREFVLVSPNSHTRMHNAEFRLVNLLQTSSADGQCDRGTRQADAAQPIQRTSNTERSVCQCSSVSGVDSQYCVAKAAVPTINETRRSSGRVERGCVRSKPQHLLPRTGH